jgi:hypothetical protein
VIWLILLVDSSQNVIPADWAARHLSVIVATISVGTFRFLWFVPIRLTGFKVLPEKNQGLSVHTVLRRLALHFAGGAKSDRAIALLVAKRAVSRHSKDRIRPDFTRCQDFGKIDAQRQGHPFHQSDVP